MHPPFLVSEVKRGELTFKLKISSRWKIHPIFHVSLLAFYQASAREGREQPPSVPEDIAGDLIWQVEKIVKSEVITHKRKVGRCNNEFQELRYFVKWKDFAEDDNT